MASVFDTIRQAAGDRDLSINWYKKKVADLSNRISAARLMRDGTLKRAPSFNKLHFFMTLNLKQHCHTTIHFHLLCQYNQQQVDS